jgi:GntR family transcriptional repressor for pyruvate dehydrogenase complex
VSSSRAATADPGSTPLAPLDAVFAPVRSQTAFEETVDRLGMAIKLGLLPPGSRLPAERELCARLGIARSTLRQALTALTQSGHVFATRGRGGGTFVSDPQPPADPPSKRLLAEWRETCDQRLAVELGVAVLAAQRAAEPALAALEEVASVLDASLEDFAAYRQADVRLHVGLAEATGSTRLVRAMTEAQGAMTDLI